ncbi:unnamed protein product [Moneuplotes crassus]|uniref:CKK domain-containing protein n=1 Tax=Euplotes crassus TaxID=5936 RepID=A0AAD2D6Z0_EUPCR|nr:unnamed protein product [Moneuplotes crassus]
METDSAQSSHRHAYIDFNTTEGMMPLEQSSSDQNCDPESITEEEIALVDEHVLKNIHRHKSKRAQVIEEDQLEHLIRNRNSEIFKESNNKVQKEIKQKMANLQKQIESKHKRHQEVNMSKQKAALDLIKKKTEMEKMKKLQKFSSNMRYTDDPEFGGNYSESYQKCGLNLPGIVPDSERSEDNQIFEEEFEAITEDVKDLNTSQTGKGQSQEENSHSSNLGKTEQNSEGKTDSKPGKKKTIEEEKVPPKKKASGLKISINDPIIEKRTEKITQEVRRESELPVLPPVSPNTNNQIKARLIQTADNIRMPKIDKKPNQDLSHAKPPKNVLTPKGNNFARKRPYEDAMSVKKTGIMYRTINNVPSSPGPHNRTLQKNHLSKKFSFNLNENQPSRKVLEVKGDNMFATFRRDTYQDHQMLEKINEDSDLSEDAIIECSNEQDDWKEPSHLRTIKKKKTPNKNSKNHKRYKFSAKIQAQPKVRNEVKTPVHKTRTSIHLSFGNNPGKTQQAYEHTTPYLSPHKATSLKTVRGIQERRFPEKRVEKFNHLFDKGIHNTVRVSKTRYSMENTTSVRPPTYKMSPKGSRINSRDARAVFKSPRTPANFSVKKISITRESSVEEVKQYDIKASKGRIIRRIARSGIRKNSKIRETQRLATSNSLKITGVGGDSNKSKEIPPSYGKIENSYHRKVIKTIIAKICLPRGKKCKSERKKAIDIINNESQAYFAILFGRKKFMNSNNFKGVYKHICGTHLLKIYGDPLLPPKISCKMIEGFFKFDVVLNKLMPIPTQTRISEQFHAFYLDLKKWTSLQKSESIGQRIYKLRE